MEQNDEFGTLWQLTSGFTKIPGADHVVGLQGSLWQYTLNGIEAQIKINEDPYRPVLRHWLSIVIINS